MFFILADGTHNEGSNGLLFVLGNGGALSKGVGGDDGGEVGGAKGLEGGSGE